MDVHVNQHGYETEGYKRAVVGATRDGDRPTSFAVVDPADGTVVHEGDLDAVGPVANWGAGEWRFWTATFSSVTAAGTYWLRVERSDGDPVHSPQFEVDDAVHRNELVTDLLHYFTTQRCRGRYEAADAALPFVGDREDRVDVRGGWYDASGDHSKYVSHLGYANYWNPQQIPLVTWSLVDGHERLRTRDADLAGGNWERFLEEAAVGADFLVRACDDEGYFYTTVYDGWSKDPAEREVCAFEGRDGEKTDDYRAGFRRGGGVAVAALARAGSVTPPSRGDLPKAAPVPGTMADLGSFSAEEYLGTARRAFDHLAEHNEAYLPDGTENLLDDYAALLGATELAAATGEDRYRVAARDRARSLVDRQAGDDRYDGWWAADDGERPFFHSTDEGLPVVALCRFLAVDRDGPVADEVRAALGRYWSFALGITDDVANPYGYARQYARPVDADAPRASFFVPHENETGYWWLGENARIASLASAAFRTLATVEDPNDLDVALAGGNAVDGASGDAAGTADGDAADADDPADRLERFGVDQVDWILGRNPFGVSMMRGVGRPEPRYEHEHPNAPGGIINGVTAAEDDYRDVAFCPSGAGQDHDERWRWAEQWLPHAAWFLQSLVWADRL